MQTHGQPAQPPNIGRPTPPYDWTRFGRHRLRAPNATIIDLPLPVTSTARLWVATIWPDPHAPGGWGRHLWTVDPAVGRGWQLPHQLAAGDIVEFGADTPAGPVRWYGIMDSYQSDRWATIQGPYPHPADAYENAQRLLALERYVEPLPADPPTPPVNPAIERRARCRRPGDRHPSRPHRPGSSPI